MASAASGSDGPAQENVAQPAAIVAISNDCSTPQGKIKPRRANGNDLQSSGRKPGAPPPQLTPAFDDLISIEGKELCPLAKRVPQVKKAGISAQTTG